MTHRFHPSVLREYDVRGIVGKTLHEADAYALGRSYAALALSEGAKRIAVGRDGRTHSPQLEAALVRGLTESGLDVVRIGVGPSPAAGLLAEAIEGLGLGREVRFSVAAGVYEKMIDDLIRGRLDLLVALRQVDRNEPLVREEVLGDVAYVVVAGASHPLVGRKKIALTDIASERWLAGTDIGAVERAYLASFAAAGTPLGRPEIETTSVLFAHATLDHGAHLAILPELMVRREVRAGRLVILDVDAEPWTRPLVIATRVRAPTPPLVASLVEQLKRSFAQAGG